jgi:hypothetical protein
VNLGIYTGFFGEANHLNQVLMAAFETRRTTLYITPPKLSRTRKKQIAESWSSTRNRTLGQKTWGFLDWDPVLR